MDIFTDLVFDILETILDNGWGPSRRRSYRGPGEPRYIVELPPEEAELQFKVNERMEALRQNRAELLARFDVDGNGVLDNEELQAARDELAAEIRAELSEVVLAHHTPAPVLEATEHDATDDTDGHW